MEQEKVGYNKITIETSDGEVRTMQARSFACFAVVDEENGVRVRGNTKFCADFEDAKTDIIAVYSLMKDLSERLLNNFPFLDEVYNGLKEDGEIDCVEVFENE